MNRPDGLATKIFLDSGDPEETKRIKALLGFLDGQTTNPTLVTRNPELKARIDAGEKLTKEEANNFYRQVVTDVSALVPDSVSIEVYADASTIAEDMLSQAREMWKWVDNAHIKFPTTAAGLTAAEQFVSEGGRVNMTLVFTQEQAAAVYAATRGAKKGDVYVSPFIGRLDDLGQNGMDLIANILKMYKSGDGHVEVLTASVRSMEHFLATLKLGSDIITSPAKFIEAWVAGGAEVPGEDFVYAPDGLAPIAYKELDLDQDWKSFDISHPLTDKGVERFAADWQAIVA